MRRCGWLLTVAVLACTHSDSTRRDSAIADTTHVAPPAAPSAFPVNSDTTGTRARDFSPQKIAKRAKRPVRRASSARIDSRGAYRWGYLAARGRIVIGQPIPPFAEPCEPFLDEMRTCSIREIDGTDTAWVNMIVRHGRVYHIDIQKHGHDLRQFYNRLIATLGDPVAGARPFGSTTTLYWRGKMTCARVVPASAAEANGEVVFQLWDGREEGGCRFE